MFPRAQVIHGARQLRPEDRQGCGFAVCVFQFRKIFLPQRILPSEEDGGFGTGPAQRTVADLFARRAQAFAIGFLGALHQPTIRDEVLDPRKAREVLHLI